MSRTPVNRRQFAFTFHLPGSAFFKHVALSAVALVPASFLPAQRSLHLTPFAKPGLRSEEPRFASARAIAEAFTLPTVGPLLQDRVLSPTSNQSEASSLPVSSQTSGSSTLVASSTGEQAAAAFKFLDSVGVVTHLSYDNTPYYSAWSTVLSKLKQAGIMHIRDGYGSWTSASPFVSEHRQLAAAGIHCTYMIPWEAHASTAALQSFAPLVTDMDALEGPNECDAGTNCGGGGAIGIQNAAAEMPTLTAAGKALHVPVLGPSFTTAEAYQAVGNLASLVDYTNLHVYYANRNPGTQGWGAGDALQNRYGSLAFWVDQGASYAVATPQIITETGYVNTSALGPGVLPESIAASYIPRTFLTSFNRGVKRSFAYELLDEVSSPGYGLLNADMSEKPAFTAMRNLMTLLNDDAVPFTPAKLTYTLNGGTSTLTHTLLQKRNGGFYLILWSEESSFDAWNNIPTPVSTQNISLAVQRGMSISHIYRFDSAGNTSVSNASGTSLTTPVNDHLTVIAITPAL